MDFILPLILCILFVRNHLFAIAVYCTILLLRFLNMTVMLMMPGMIVLVIVAILLLALLYFFEKQTRVIYLRSTLITTLAIILWIVRFPINFIYIQDIIFRIQHWVPLPTNKEAWDQPSLGAAVGGMLSVPFLLMIIISAILLAVYFKKYKQANA